MTRTDRVIAELRQHIPTDARTTAHKVMAAYDALSRGERERRRDSETRGHWFPEVGWLAPSITQTYQPLVLTERAGHDCTAFWAALDAGVSESAIRMALRETRAHIRANPRMNFAEIARKKLNQARRTGSAARPIRPAPVTPDTHPRTLAALARAAAAANITPSDWMCRAVIALGVVTDADPSSRHVAPPASEPATRPTAPQKTTRAQYVWLVMGDDTLDITSVIRRLEERDSLHPDDDAWTPRSTNLRGYISGILASNKKMFEGLGGGVYRRAAPQSAPTAIDPATDDDARRLRVVR